MKTMITNTIRTGTRLRAVLGLALTIASVMVSSAADNRAPEVPPTIKVDDGHVVHFRGFAIGVQIYTWDGTSWGNAVPRATLFDDDGNIVIEHTGGPTWTSNSKSVVVGALPPKSAIVNDDAIPWLLLAADKERTHGPGILANTTFIHRVNTAGGKAPAENGTTIGQVAQVPYIADYFFYRQETN
jgi:hypothetical protein